MINALIHLLQASSGEYIFLCVCFLLRGGLDELNNCTKLVSRRVCVTPKSSLLNCLLHLVMLHSCTGKVGDSKCCHRTDKSRNKERSGCDREGDNGTWE